MTKKQTSLKTFEIKINKIVFDNQLNLLNLFYILSLL